MTLLFVVCYVSILPHCQNCLLDTRPALFPRDYPE